MKKEWGKQTVKMTALSAALMGLMIFAVYYFSIPNPNMVLITALVLFTGMGGLIPGAVSAVMMMVYSMFFFSTDHSFFEYTDVNMQKILVIFAGIIFCYLIVGLLKHNRDKNRGELLESNRRLQEMYQSLEEKSEADAKVAELSRSVTSLLTNMPALTFSKDISTGKYLACNQLFAEYAHKASPEGVVGLTDHDIFDPKTADHFVEDDRIALSRDEPYIFFEDVPDAAGFPRHFQTTKQKFTDEQGRLCTLGMCVDVTELVNMKQETQEIRQAFEQSRYESLIYTHIASSLSADYTYVYYVDLETEEYVEYTSDADTGKLSVATRGRDFFAAFWRDAQTQVYENDRERFITAFTKEKITDALRKRDRFNLIYRLIVDGAPKYVNMKATWMKDDESHIVIGVMDIDAQMRARELENRIREERIAYARVNALTGDFIAVYSVDPESCRFREYSASEDYKELSLLKEGEDFFAQARKDAERVIYSEDLEKFQALFTRINVMREINTNGLFAIKYRILLDRRPVYVRLKAALVEEKDGLRLIVGVLNIAEQVKQDQEYEYHLSVARAMANKDELTGVKNKHAYADTERELNQQIEGWEPVQFALAVFDVNELKNINDTQGHQAGDEYLKRASHLICTIFKHSPVFRIGGDEFAVISRGSDYESFDQLIEELERSNQANLSQGGVVIACGAVRYTGERNVAAVFEKADRLMYENKKRLKALAE